jgi:hypothetical protein
MIQGLEVSAFSCECLRGVFVAGEVFLEEFDRDGSRFRNVLRLPHFAHSAGADFPSRVYRKPISQDLDGHRKKLDVEDDARNINRLCAATRRIAA